MSARKKDVAGANALKGGRLAQVLRISDPRKHNTATVSPTGWRADKNKLDLPPTNYDLGYMAALAKAITRVWTMTYYKKISRIGKRMHLDMEKEVSKLSVVPTRYTASYIESLRDVLMKLVPDIPHTKELEKRVPATYDVQFMRALGAALIAETEATMSSI